MAYGTIASAAFELLRRQEDEIDPEEPTDAGQKELFSSWALLIVILLLIAALFTSYVLQLKKIEAVHETVISIFAGMVVGLIVRVSPGTLIQDSLSFDYQFFFNLLLPPIILASGYELHQSNFFRNIGSILTFAFAGTFISAVSLGTVLWLFTRIPWDVDLSFVEALSVGATLSATDPVTILAIFNVYKVEPKLYTIIFGESILNDAIAIVLFETAQRYKEGGSKGNLNIFSLFEAIGVFLLIFFGSLFIGVVIGIGSALMLKYTYIRRFPKIESCLILLIAYASYFFSNGVHMSGIVSLLFCGITLKHYAYYNMSRRTQLTTKFIFQILAQLSENFIFIYLGLTLFVETNLDFRPMFILVTLVGICGARWLSVFPLSKAINYVIRLRARRKGQPDAADELPWHYQAMLFWAGLRGAVGVALAAGLQGENGPALRATVLVVVVLTVIIFGGTTARMLEILGIRTGVVEEIDSDDEFDIETANGGTYYKRSGTGFGHNPKPSISLDYIENDESTNGRANGSARPSRGDRGYSSSNRHSPPIRPGGRSGSGSTKQRTNSTISSRDREQGEQAGRLLDGSYTPTDDDSDDGIDLDLPPAAPRRKSPSPMPGANRSRGVPGATEHDADDDSGDMGGAGSSFAGAGGVGNGIRDLWRGARGAMGAADHTAWLRQLDEDYIKPTLLLDQGQGQGRNHPDGGGGPAV